MRRSIDDNEKTQYTITESSSDKILASNYVLTPLVVLANKVDKSWMLLPLRGRNELGFLMKADKVSNGSIMDLMAIRIYICKNVCDILEVIYIVVI